MEKPIDNRLPIRIQIADRTLKMKVPASEEAYLRDAGKIIRDQIEKHRQAGHRDTQDILAMIALDCLVARIKGDDQLRRIQEMVYDKITLLDRIVSPSLV